MAWLINASQLDKFRKNQKNVIVLDASWHFPEENRNAQEEFLAQHVIGARFFDLTQFSDTTSHLPNMLLRDESLISQKLGELGITNEHKIIFYDNSSLHTSCRALWMMKVFGHNPHLLYILDGGFAAWRKYGGKIENQAPRNIVRRNYQVNFQAQLVRTLVQIKTNLHHPTEQLIDTRHAIRYCGGVEHRPNLRQGHIPGSFCFPYMTMFEAAGQFKPIEKIKKQLLSLGVTLEAPIVTTCGSGISSAILNFALDLMNDENHALYDGSWSEWGAKDLYPGETALTERPVATIFD